MTTDGSGTFKHPTTLVMYAPSCADTLIKHQISLDLIPPLPYMIGFLYDWETYPKLIWFDEKVGSSLNDRFKGSQCLTVLYFAKGAEYSTPTSTWSTDSGTTFRDWSWDQLKYQTKILNKLKFDVEVKIIGPYENAKQDFELKKNDEKIITAYASLHVHVLSAETGKQVAFFILDGVSEFTIPDVPEEDVTEVEKIEKAQKVQSALNDDLWMLARAWSKNVKQPLHLPHFTPTGYEVRDIPTEAYNRLLNFYKEERGKRSVEPMARSLVNQREVDCYMLRVPQEIWATVAPTVQEILENWCRPKLSLKVTNVYGIRIYETGNNLRMHTDRIATHVISAILRIAQDEDSEGWPLEVITPEGRRLNVTLAPGKMLLYESATLIHGRPSPFKGKGFANAFMHFMPVSGWGYSDDFENHFIRGVPDDLPYFPLNEPEWFWKKHGKFVKDEL